jgi:hypothetical protein
VFDRDLILDELDSLHHQAKNLLLRFKARVIERCADITTKLRPGARVIVFAAQANSIVHPVADILQRLALAVGINPDGQTRTLDPADAVRRKMLLGAIYRAELSRELQREFGVEIERAPKGMYDIKGVPEDLKADHSTRRRQILDAMEREGVTGAKAASAFVLTTRKVKEYIPREELFKEWAERGREYGLDEREIAGRREFDPPTREQTKESLGGVLDALTKDKAYFTEASLLKGLAVEAQYSGAGFAQCSEVGEEYLEKQAVHLGMEKGQKLYTTPEIDRLEKRMLGQVIEGRGREFPAFRPSSGLVDVSGLSEE